MDHLLRAIVDDDRKAVKALLDENAALATSLMRKPRLFNSGIFHWLYIGDTPLHLAAVVIGSRLFDCCSPRAPTPTQ